MARLTNVNIHANKRFAFIFMIGNTSAKMICSEARISEKERVKELDDQELINLCNIIEKKM